MNLPQESDERNIAGFAPMVSSNIKLNFFYKQAASVT
jgi:hypothetical protein